MIKMKIWINKCIEEEKSIPFQSSLTFNIDVPGSNGVVTSDIRAEWYKLLGYKSVPVDCEDLFIIAMSVFAADKRVPRSIFDDAWTRTLTLSIPVLNLEKWNAVKLQLEKMLTYLSGDIWTLHFRAADAEKRYQDHHKREIPRKEILNRISGVSLFSGGMDSYCGAYKFLSQGENIIFVGFKEYDRLKDVQADLLKHIQDAIPGPESFLFRFTTKAYVPVGGTKSFSENTSRSRSFLFLCAALCVAEIVGDGIPVYIPENGFIGLNLPMTAGRKGSCSTRTTHPYFLKMFNSLLDSLEIHHKIINPFAFTTKREMVIQHKDAPGFLANIHQTISCSHPRNGRWQGITVPENCGYCYPCLIRQSSLLDVDIPCDCYANDTISYDYIMHATESKRSDMVDLLSAVSAATKSTDEELIARIRKTGQLTEDESFRFLRVYKETIKDLVRLFSRDPELLRIMGITYATN